MSADPPPAPPIVPAVIQVSDGSAPFLLLHATGTQNYICRTAGAWTFEAPSATLHDDQGNEAGTHFAGPTWKAVDGSAVVGAMVANVTQDPDSIPWLLLRAVSTTLGPEGGDLLVTTAYIQRVNTSGGLSPVTGCDVGDTANVPYTADYYFYRPAPGRAAEGAG